MSPNMSKKNSRYSRCLWWCSAVSRCV